MFRNIFRKSFVARCLYYCVDDFFAGRRFRSGNINTSSGTLHSTKDLDESIRYINEVFNDYKKYSGLSTFSGTVAEIGPGDSCGVALRFLADGCSHVDLVDRFYSKRSDEKNMQICKEIQKQYPSLKACFPTSWDGDDASVDGISRRYGEEASAENFFQNMNQYDFIVSRAVMEHVQDPELSIRRMAQALKPSGYLLHKVDLRDHGLFTPYYHELKYLEVPDIIYKRMTKDSGKPNRVLVNRYRELLRKHLPKFQIYVTHLANVGEINPHLPYETIPRDLRRISLEYVSSVRHKFAKSLRDTSSEDLSVTGFFLVANK